jgi:hypothetical protein
MLVHSVAHGGHRILPEFTDAVVAFARGKAMNPA